MMRPPSAPTTRIGAYAFVMIASGKLKSSPKTSPISQPGQEGNWTKGITNPIANRLKKAPSKAVFLSGNDIGSIKQTSTVPKISPLKRPDKRGVMQILDQFGRGTVKPVVFKRSIATFCAI